MEVIKAKPLPGDDDQPWAVALIPGIGVVEFDPEEVKEMLGNED